jgi:hypothetical protein
MKFPVPKYWRLRTSTFELTDFNVGSFNNEKIDEFSNAFPLTEVKSLAK